MVFVIGGYQTDFARNWHREGHDFAGLFAEVVRETLADAGISPPDVGVIHVGNAFGQLFTGQGQLGGKKSWQAADRCGSPRLVAQLNVATESTVDKAGPDITGYYAE